MALHMEQPQNKDKKKQKSVNQYIRFTGIVFQMMGIIGAGTWFGIWLDGQQGENSQLFTIIFSLLSVFAALYLVIKDVMKHS